MNYNHIKKLIEKDQLDAAFEQMISAAFITGKVFYSEIILQRGALAELNRNVMQGVIKTEDSYIYKFRIRLAALKLLSQIEEEASMASLKVTTSDYAQTSDYKVLFLAANPNDSTRLRLDIEFREIAQTIRLSTNREQLDLQSRWAVTPSTLQQAILDEKPNIIHFAGHGTEAGLILEDVSGKSKKLEERALDGLFALFASTIQCVVLNACYSETQAKIIIQHIPFVIGMNTAMPDRAAIVFAIGFYRALSSNKDIQFAYHAGINAIQLEGLYGSNIPQLLEKDVTISKH